MKSNPKMMTDQIRKFVDASGISRRHIAKATGVPEPSLSRFMSRERELSVKSLNVLCEYLNLIVVRRGESAEMDVKRSSKRKAER